VELWAKAGATGEVIAARRISDAACLSFIWEDTNLFIRIPRNRCERVQHYWMTLRAALYDC
jgi:hypothetical protein